MTFGFAEAVAEPEPVNGAATKLAGENGTHAATPLRAAVNT